jgi:Domain of unknown function (DUF1918)
MQAAIGDRLCIRGNSVGTPDKIGEIVEVKGKAGEPPYLVRFDDGHTGLVFPGPDAVVEAKKKGRTKPASRGKSASTGSAKSGPARKKTGK